MKPIEIHRTSNEVPNVGDKIRTKKSKMEGVVTRIVKSHSGYPEIHFTTGDGRTMKTPLTNVTPIQMLDDEGMEEGMMGGINRSHPAQDVSYEKVLDDDIYEEILSRWMEENRKDRRAKDILPGATRDDKHKGWKIVYEIKPKQPGSNVYKGMATHGKSQHMEPITLQGNSPDDVVDKLKKAIDEYTGKKQITSSKVMVDFNKALATDIIGHGGEIFAEIINLHGKPVLLLSPEQEGGMQRAMDRTATANKREGHVGQQAFAMNGQKAAEAGLTHARYTVGDPFTYMGNVVGYPLNFDSEVYPGETIPMNAPGVTVAYPR